MKKGFTLIELLAVIVILAIIALIATPIILEVINNTKEEANKRSVEMYAKALENAVAKTQLNNEIEYTGIYSIEDFPIEVEYDGNVICDRIDIYESGSIYVEGCKIDNSDKKYNYGKKLKYKNGEIVYFNVKDGVSCTESEYTEENSLTGYNGINSTGNQTSCLKFYAFNDNEKNEKVSLLLDHNTTATTYWNSGGSNVKGPNVVLELLYNDTKLWNGTELLEDYTMDQRGRVSNAYYTIEYSKTPLYTNATTPFKARLITVQEVAQITNNTTFNEVTSIDEKYYFDSNSTDPSETCVNGGDITGCKYSWLYDRTHKTSCVSNGCYNNSNDTLYGYWTASSWAANSSFAWIVSYHGYLIKDYVELGTSNGVRPVIEVLKSKLS